MVYLCAKQEWYSRLMDMLYSLPGLIALAGKLLIFLLYRSSMRSLSIWSLLFFLSMLLLNFAELAILNNAKVNVNGYILILAYYFFATSSAMALFSFSLELNQVSTRKILIISGPVYVICQAVLFSGYGISGFQDIGYSLSRVAGDFYWVIQITLVSSFCIAIYAFYACYKKESSSWLDKSRSLILLTALLPSLIAMIVVIIAMQVGAKINATVVLSVFSTYMIAVIIYTESATNVCLFIEKVPGTQLNIINREFEQAYNNAINDRASLRDVTILLEQKMIQRQLMIHNYNKTLAAASLGLTPQTLRRKIQRYEEHSEA